MADAQNKQAHSKQVPGDLLRRGVPTRCMGPLSLFAGLRLLDPLLLYGILGRGLGSGLLNAVGLRTLPPGLPLQTGFGVVDALGLSPYRLVVLAMGSAVTAKKLHWLTVATNEEMSYCSVGIVSASLTGSLGLGALLFTTEACSASLASGGLFPQMPFLVGTALFAVGLGLQVVSELQRRTFKKKPENRGKLYTGGLFRFSRHINHLGFVLWQAGYATATASWAWGLFTTVLSAYNVAARAIPPLEKYCSEKYGEQWQQYKSQTPCSLVPYVV